MMGRRNTAGTHWKIVGNVNAGLTQKEAANCYGCSQTEVSQVLRKWHQTQSVDDRPCSGRPRKTNARQDWHLLQMAHQKRFMSAVKL